MPGFGHLPSRLKSGHVSKKGDSEYLAEKCTSLEISFEPLWNIPENGVCYVMLILLSFKLPFVIPLQNRCFRYNGKIISWLNHWEFEIDKEGKSSH